MLGQTCQNCGWRSPRGPRLPVDGNLDLQDRGPGHTHSRRRTNASVRIDLNYFWGILIVAVHSMLRARAVETLALFAAGAAGIGSE